MSEDIRAEEKEADSPRTDDLHEPPDPGTALDLAVARFAGALSGLRDLQEQIAPHAAKLDEEEPRTSLNLRMTREEAEHIVPLLERLQHPNEEVEDGANTDTDDGPQVEEPAPTAMEKSISDESEEDAKIRDEIAETLRTDPTWQAVIARGLREAVQSRPRRHGLLLNSLVTTSVSAFEVLIAEVYRTHARLHPGTMGQEQIALSDLLTYDSVQEAVDEALGRRVDAFLRRSFKDWCNWFEEQLKIKPDTLAIDWDETIEVFERRNVLVHNDGRVSRQYRERVGTGEVGKRLKVDDAYVSHALDHVLALGTLLGLLAWLKLMPDKTEEAIKSLYDRMWESMLANRWTVVETVTRVGCSLNPSESTRLIFQVNHWQARGRLLGREAIVEEVDAWDVSALSERFQLGKAALLGDVDGSLELAKSLVHSNDLGSDDLRTWPLLEDLRNHPDFPALLDEADSRRDSGDVAEEDYEDTGLHQVSDDPSGL